VKNVNRSLICRYLWLSIRYLNWAIAEFSTIVTDLPEVIGIGIACNIFFGWPYYAGVILSLITTMLFLATMDHGIKVLEGIVFLFVFVMAVALFVEMSFVGVNTQELVEGWFIGFKDVTGEDVSKTVVPSCVAETGDPGKSH
jgi:NRAMP (natural resistance-associated macrophage protein)-like metal ion transporter